MKMLTNVILSGGAGVRLWPLSRQKHPKQFVKIFNNCSTFQLTLQGNCQICNQSMIVSHQAYQGIINDQIREMGLTIDFSVWEPLSKNTASAIILACLSLDPKTIVLVTPADHLIDYGQEYREAVNKAYGYALKDFIVTFGIIPSTPHIGYGYLEVKGNDVVHFHEKPDADTAKRYLESKNFLWNSGIYCFKVEKFLTQIHFYAPEVYEKSLKAFQEGRLEKNELKLLESSMSQIPNISIDYALMEQASCLKVIPSYFSWDDVGSFESLHNQLPIDEQGNSIGSKMLYRDSKNTFVFSDKRVIASVGVEDMIIIDTPDALLVSKRGMSSKIKEMLPEIELIREESIEQASFGYVNTLEKGVGYSVKKILIHPGHWLFLKKQDQHLIVISGKATVINEVTTEVFTNQSIYLFEECRLENRGTVDLVLIEVQSFF